MLHQLGKHNIILGDLNKTTVEDLALLAVCDCCRGSGLPNPIPPLTLAIVGFSTRPFQGILKHKHPVLRVDNCYGILLIDNGTRLISCRLHGSPLVADFGFRNFNATGNQSSLAQLPPLITIVDVPAALRCIAPWLVQAADPEQVEKRFVMRYLGVGLTRIVWVNEEFELLEGIATDGHAFERQQLVVARSEFEPAPPRKLGSMTSIIDVTFLDPSLHAFAICSWDGLAKGFAVYDFFTRAELYRVPPPDSSLAIMRCCSVPGTLSDVLVTTPNGLYRVSLNERDGGKSSHWNKIPLKEASDGHYGVTIIHNQGSGHLCAISRQAHGVMVVDYVTGALYYKLMWSSVVSFYDPRSRQLLISGPDGIHVFE